MADKKISELTAVSLLDKSDVTVVVNLSETKKATIENLLSIGNFNLAAATDVAATDYLLLGPNGSAGKRITVSNFLQNLPVQPVFSTTPSYIADPSETSSAPSQLPEGSTQHFVISTASGNSYYYLDPTNLMIGEERTLVFLSKSGSYTSTIYLKDGLLASKSIGHNTVVFTNIGESVTVRVFQDPSDSFNKWVVVGHNSATLSTT
jgi:hypothetical protein